MKTSVNDFQQLLEQTTSLYNYERKIAEILPSLHTVTSEPLAQEGLMREAEENKKQCERLEGLLTILNQTTKSKTDAAINQDYLQQYSTMLKRVTLRHTNAGYKTAICIAMTVGQCEIADLLNYNVYGICYRLHYQ